MKTKKMVTDEGGGCVSTLRLSRKKGQRAELAIGNAPVELGLYKLYRLRDWVSAAIDEFEDDVEKGRFKK